MLIQASNSLAVAVDIQERLFPVMQQKESLAQSIAHALAGFQILDIPILFTEQTPTSLGPTINQIRRPYPNHSCINKDSFSCWKEPEFARTLQEKGKKQILLMGIEAHVCITQTSLDLLQAGYSVFVAADAVSSSQITYKEWALARMRQAGATILPLEAVFFELMEDAHHPKFKEVLKMIKELHNYT